jgi:hypothetical protein
VQLAAEEPNEQNGEEDIFEFAGDSFCKKRPHQNVLICKDGTEITYETGQLVEKLWGGETARDVTDKEITTALISIFIISWIIWGFFPALWVGIWTVPAMLEMRIES